MTGALAPDVVKDYLDVYLLPIDDLALL